MLDVTVWRTIEGDVSQTLEDSDTQTEADVHHASLVHLPREQPGSKQTHIRILPINIGFHWNKFDLSKNNFKFNGSSNHILIWYQYLQLK